MRFQERRCTACNWPRSSGYISFGGKMHEPHCDACCRAWEDELRITAMLRQRLPLGPVNLEHFRAWQRERAQRMGVAA